MTSTFSHRLHPNMYTRVSLESPNIKITDVALQELRFRWLCYRPW